MTTDSSTTTTFPTGRAAILAQLTEAATWTADRVEAAASCDPRAATPCAEFDLGQLLGHLTDALALFTRALGSTVDEADSDESQTAHLARAGRAWLAAWERADLDQAVSLPFGTMPPEVAAQLNVAEVVIHGWDISRASGERADVPDNLAAQVHACGRALLTDDNRAPAFAAEQPSTGNASDRMAAFYGRTP